MLSEHWLSCLCFWSTYNNNKNRAHTLSATTFGMDNKLKITWEKSILNKLVNRHFNFAMVMVEIIILFYGPNSNNYNTATESHP